LSKEKKKGGGKEGGKGPSIPWMLLKKEKQKGSKPNGFIIVLGEYDCEGGRRSPGEEKKKQGP